MSVTNVTIPTAQSFILVDTRTGPNKVLFLPTASTIRGRYLSIKDYYGGATASTLTISTTGLDRIDQRGISYTLASSFGSVMLLSDGLRSWNMLGLYEGGDTATSTAIVVSGGAPAYTLTVLPDVRYSFLSTNYSSGSVNNIGTASATYGAASISGGTYTSASPGFITFTWGSGYIQAPSVTSIKTIIMIVRLTNTNTWSYLLDARGGLGSGYWASEIGPDWLNNSTYYRDSVQRAYVNGTSYQELNDNIWHHICLVYPTGFTDDVTFLARFTQNEAAGGSCAEIMEFTVALTQQQIKDNFNFFASRFGWTPV